MKSLLDPIKKIIGDTGEREAEKALTEAGLYTVAKNYRCKGGELDLVMLDQQQLVFVEVRVRKNDRFGTAEESIGFHKQQRIKLAAMHFLQTHKEFQRHGCRFDTYCLTNGKAQWIKSAFDA